jgi:transcriptional regulator with XRE-family HTH domain
MPRKTAPLIPSSHELLQQLGERLRLARLRRRLSAKQVASRAGMAPMTLRSLERGGSGVTIGAYLAVMQVLGVEKDLSLIAQADPMGRALQDSRLSRPTKATGPTRSSSSSRQPKLPMSTESQPGDGQDWIEKSSFASSKALANLIDAKPVRPSKAKRR